MESITKLFNPSRKTVDLLTSSHTERKMWSRTHSDVTYKIIFLSQGGKLKIFQNTFSWKISNTKIKGFNVTQKILFKAYSKYYFDLHFRQIILRLDSHLGPP